MVAGGEKDARGIEFGEGCAQELRRIRGHAIVFVQVAAAEERVGPGLPYQFRDAAERVAQPLAPPPRDVAARAGPCELRIEVQIREVHYLHALILSVGAARINRDGRNTPL